MATSGREALARVLGALSGTETADVSDELWADFKAAVAGAQAEMRETEAEGVQRWQDARHGDR